MGDESNSIKRVADKEKRLVTGLEGHFARVRHMVAGRRNRRDAPHCERHT
ncbi:hypothetical protein PMI06_003255 [Burkholderia sp. BT03]|nr:hypothetical protein PMI06_003255 [Burkholderia sp. BT03]